MQSSDHQSDMFSVAVVVYEMLTGKLPFKAFRYQDYIPSSFDEWQYQPLSQNRPDLPSWLDLTLRKALQPNPVFRYQAFSEFLMDLSQPNQTLVLAAQKRPLIQRNPLAVFQGLCVIQFVIILYLLSII